MPDKVYITTVAREKARKVMDGIAACLKYHMENNGGRRPEKLFISRELLMILWMAEPNREQLLTALDNKVYRIYDIPVAQFQGEGVEFYFSDERNWIDPEVLE